tara:strand:- start:116 stop:319 length:204 start_codon:yes stop_codon:yes gene_type:complete
MKNITASILVALALSGCITCKDPDSKEKAPDDDYYQPGFLYEDDENGNPAEEESEPEPDEKTESPKR